MRAKGNRGLLESSVGPATLKSYRSALSSFLAWLQEEGVVRVKGFEALDDLLVEYFEFVFVSLYMFVNDFPGYTGISSGSLTSPVHIRSLKLIPDCMKFVRISSICPLCLSSHPHSVCD